MEQEAGKQGRFQGGFGDGTEEVIGALIEVHRLLGPGLLESTYEACFSRELALRGIAHELQVPVPLHYKGERIDCGYRLDVVVEGRIVVELKAVEALTRVHEAQVITYLLLSGLSVGLLVNFNVKVLKDGLRRFVPHPRHFPASLLPVPNLSNRPSGS